ncbi:MAG: hypothetical protein ACR2LZ_07215 [Pyrinomonadaceae bacterium]
MKISNCLKITILVFLSFCSSTAIAQSQQRGETLEEIEDLRGRLKKLEETFLSPSAQDHAALAELLRQPSTGLIRLLPREEFDGKNRLTIRGGGAYYSFTRLTHEYGYGSDIELQGDNLSVGFAGADYGMMANISPASLEELSLDDPRVRFLAGHQPPTDEPGARAEQRRFGEGVSEDDVVYRRRVPVKKGSTYLLRSINYGNSDVLVGLHVLRRDVDGSVIIAWKMLKKYSVPQLQRAE